MTPYRPAAPAGTADWQSAGTWVGRRACRRSAYRRPAYRRPEYRRQTRNREVDVRTRGALVTLAAVAAGVATTAVLSACQRPVANVAPARPVVAAASTASAVAPPSAPPVEFTIAPADGATAVAPATPVSVLVSNGILTAVSVQASDGSAVAGVLDSATHSWVATDNLVPATTYAITATALDNDGVRTE